MQLLNTLYVTTPESYVHLDNNTVRLDIQSRREEIGVLQLLGATDGFIRRPFLYLGAWYGLGAGLLALGLLSVAHHYLAPPLAGLAASIAWHCAWYSARMVGTVSRDSSQCRNPVTRSVMIASASITAAWRDSSPDSTIWPRSSRV